MKNKAYLLISVICLCFLVGCTQDGNSLKEQEELEITVQPSTPSEPEFGDETEKLVSINANGSILQLPENNVAISESNLFGIAFELVYTMSSTSSLQYLS